MIRQAIILAAGKGKRMKQGTTDPAVLNTPKPLLELDGKPIIARTVETLIKNGLDVVIVIDPKDEALFREKLKKYKVRYAFQLHGKGTAAALAAAKDLVKDELFLVMMGDDITSIALEKYMDSNEPGVFCFQVNDVSGYGAAVLDEEGNVEEIIEKKKSGPGLANTGTYIMHSKFFDIYSKIPLDEKSQEYFLTESVKLLRELGIKFKAYDVAFWFGINTPEQLSKGRELVRRGEGG